MRWLLYGTLPVAFALVAAAWLSAGPKDKPAEVRNAALAGRV
jgi:hypothetical protein